MHPKTTSGLHFAQTSLIKQPLSVGIEEKLRCPSSRPWQRSIRLKKIRTFLFNFLTLFIWFHKNAFLPFLPERDYVTFGSLLSQFRLSSVCLSVCLSSVCRLSSVCNVGAPYSGGWTFRQNFFTAVYAGHSLTSMQNFTEIVLGEPLRRER